MILNKEDAHTVVLSLITAAAVADAEVPVRIPMPDEDGNGEEDELVKIFLKYLLCW